MDVTRDRLERDGRHVVFIDLAFTSLAQHRYPVPRDARAASGGARRASSAITPDAGQEPSGACVVAGLAQRGSPEQIAIRPSAEYSDDATMRTWHETIDTYLYILPLDRLQRKLPVLTGMGLVGHSSLRQR